MPFRYIFKQLLMPPGCLLLLLLLACWWHRRRPRLAAGCFVVGFAGLLLMSLPAVVEHAARALEREPALASAELGRLSERAQAIVVLGAGRERDAAWDTPQPGLMANERLRYAARLARASGLPLLTSGGLHYGQPPSEAAIMADSLRDDYGVAVRWQEGHSRTTWENAVDSARLLAAEGVTRVVLVTQAWHMPRARWCFEQQGLQVVGAPVGALGLATARPLGGWLPESRAMWQNGVLLNEAAGLLLYPLIYP
ncbi:YdcF family protein [Pseudomonas sp. RIT-PI-AD]|uniref:YdcF family protein n=1 Tax=Pseudomonas sp. RIT-PI-AD TaxID=3035294 RepID=UPI0021D85B07|nr:YdcF family protein [Pseudomonas sp. RIT-PI-AD]